MPDTSPLSFNKFFIKYDHMIFSIHFSSWNECFVYIIFWTSWVFLKTKSKISKTRPAQKGDPVDGQKNFRGSLQANHTPPHSSTCRRPHSVSEVTVYMKPSKGRGGPHSRVLGWVCGRLCHSSLKLLVSHCLTMGNTALFFTVKSFLI